MIQKTHQKDNSEFEANVPQEIPDELEQHPLTSWIRDKGWDWFDHQIHTLKAAQDDKDIVVFAPTGAGKTLCGFLPSLVDLYHRGSNKKLHTLYISPLKALAVDVHRNITKPSEDLDLDFTFETRTGDTPQSRRARQKKKPPDMLMTTPESLALMLSYEDSHEYFKDLKFIIIDELHAFLHSKRADLLSLNLERLNQFAPQVQRIGLSATICDKETAKDWLCRKDSSIVQIEQKVLPQVKILQSDQRMPWSGHSATYAVEQIYEAIKKVNLAVVFVNTRAQAEFMFQSLWQLNDDNLKIGVHHGSLEKELRRKVEAHMASGELDCVVATGSLDLGLDWADVDLVLQVGAPKGVSRLIQRIGRSNHRLNEPSQALLVPTNRFEYIECLAAIEEIQKGHLDGIDPKEGSLDVLAQHIFGVACHRLFDAQKLYEEVIKAWPYKNLSEKDFYDCVAFVKDGGYALKSYERFSRLVEDGDQDNVFKLRDKRDARRYRMNIGTIVEAPMLKVMMRNRTLGNIEENFINNLTEGDTFLFGGKVLRFDGIHNAIVKVSKSKDKQAKIPSYAGGRMPLSTHLSNAVRGMIGNPNTWAGFPEQIQFWLKLQQEKSSMPDQKRLLVETFPRDKKHYMVAYTFIGWNANQTLGYLVLRRMKRLNLKPLGFVMTDYALTVWSFNPIKNPEEIFEPGLIYEDFEEWIFDTPLIKRLFRDTAVISGLVERRHPGEVKTGRQVLMSTDLIYDVLMKYEPEHILLKAAYEDARHGLIDSDRLRDFLIQSKENIEHKQLDQISPMAVPAVLLIQRETVAREEREDYVIEDMEAEILAEAGIHDPN
ncbi:MAG: ligase-associated DNA damage response DEXH box helicase [Pseudomonadota bacterium]